MSDLEMIRQKTQQLNPMQLQMLDGFVNFLCGQQDGTIAPEAEYSADYTEWKKKLRKDIGFIEKYTTDPFHVDEDDDFLSREEANER